MQIIIDLTKERGNSSQKFHELRKGLETLGPTEAHWLIRPDQSLEVDSEDARIIEEWAVDRAVVDGAVTWFKDFKCEEDFMFVSYSGFRLATVPKILREMGASCVSRHVDEITGTKTFRNGIISKDLDFVVPDYAVAAAVKALGLGGHVSSDSALSITQLRPRMCFIDERCRKSPGEGENFVSALVAHLSSKMLVKTTVVGTQAALYLSSESPSRPDSDSRGKDRESKTLSLRERVQRVYDILKRQGLTCPPEFRDVFIAELENTVASGMAEPLDAEDLIQEVVGGMPLERLGSPSAGQVAGYVRGMKHILVKSGVLITDKNEVVDSVLFLPGMKVAKVADSASDRVVSELLFVVLEQVDHLDSDWNEALLWVLFGRKNETPEERRTYRKALARAYRLLYMEKRIVMNDFQVMRA